MANEKISAMPSASAFAGTELIAMVQSATNVSGTPAQMKTFILGNVTLTNPATAATLTIANNKTLTVNNILTLAGTDSTTMTFPSTSATIARTDAAQSFTGIQTFNTAIAPGSGGSGVANTGNLTWNAAQTFSFTASQTMTFPAASDTLAGLGTAQTFSAANTFSAAGAASTPGLFVSGAHFTGGTGTTTFPQLTVQDSTASASSTWSTTGTAIGANAHTGIGNLIDLQLDGTSKFSVSSGGTVTSAAILSSNTVQAGGNFNFSWAGHGILSSPASASVQFGAADTNPPVAQTTRMQSATGSNIAGQNWTYIGSLSTGSGTSGDIIFQTGGTGAGAAVQNTATTALTIKGATQNVIIASGLNASGSQVRGVTTVAAAGATQGTATAIAASAAVVNVTVTVSTEGVKLPTVSTGKMVILLTPTNKGYKVYAAAAGQVINAATTATTAYAMATNRPAIFYGVDTTHWRAVKGS